MGSYAMERAAELTSTATTSGRRAAGAEVLGEPHDAMGGAQRGYSARDLEGNLWSFGTARPRR
jgi:hypothetical protein